MATVQERTGLQEKVIAYLQDAHAMEQNVLRMLDSMIATTSDPEARRQLKRHHMDTQRHERMVRERLEQLGTTPSLLEDVPAIAAAWMKGWADMVRADKPGKNARDGYVTEHVEIAAYALLEELALHAGDIETARMARFIRDDEEQMARWINSHWRKFIELTLAEDGYPPRVRSQADVERLMRPAGSSSLEYLALAAGLGLAGWLVYSMIGKARS